jgi:hypothetical protein
MGSGNNNNNNNNKLNSHTQKETPLTIIEPWQQDFHNPYADIRGREQKISTTFKFNQTDTTQEFTIPTTLFHPSEHNKPSKHSNQAPITHKWNSIWKIAAALLKRFHILGLSGLFF